MPKYHVSILNEHFTSDEELDSANMDDAIKLALKGALDIASEHVSSGQPFFGAHLTLKEGTKDLVQMVVSVGAAPLKS